METSRKQCIASRMREFADRLGIDEHGNSITPADCREAADEIDRLKSVESNLRKSFSEHCQDCCCARSWKALGISAYTGLSIPEHIQRLRGALYEIACGTRAWTREEMLDCAMAALGFEPRGTGETEAASNAEVGPDDFCDDCRTYHKGSCATRIPDLCVVCKMPLPPVAEWSAPACPRCTEVIDAEPCKVCSGFCCGEIPRLRTESEQLRAALKTVHKMAGGHAIECQCERCQIFEFLEPIVGNSAPDSSGETILKPRGKPCTCDNCLGSSCACRVDAGETLGELWYCQKRAAEAT